MSTINVGIGEWAVSANPDDVIKTYALGSCIGVMIYDKELRIAGMIHIALPDSSIDADRARNLPGYFADSGLPLMIEEMKKKGALRANIWVKIAGGSTMMDDAGIFDIGKRNILAAKKVLWKSSLGPIAEDIGGTISRTVAFTVSNGDTILTSGGKAWPL